MIKREPSKSFRDLVVWQKARQLLLEIYIRVQKLFQKKRFIVMDSADEVGKILEAYMQAIRK